MQFGNFIVLLCVCAVLVGCRARAVRDFPGTHNTSTSPRKYKAELKREYKKEMKRMKQVPKSEVKVQEWTWDAHSQNDDTHVKARWFAWHFWNEQIGSKEDRKKRREQKKKQKAEGNRKKKAEHRKRK